MRRIRRHLSPSMVVALAALAMATTGTAFAAGVVIITRPSQLADRVVENRALGSMSVDSTKIMNNSIELRDQRHPVLHASLSANGTLASGGNAYRSERVGPGHYLVTFSSSDLMVGELRGCAYSVTAAPFQHVVGEAEWQGGMTASVYTNHLKVERGPWGDAVAFIPMDTGFDLIAAC